MKLLQERIQLLSYPTRQTRTRTTAAQRLALTELDGSLLREEVARLRDDDVARVRRPGLRRLLAHLAVAPVSPLAIGTTGVEDVHKWKIPMKDSYAT